MDGLIMKYFILKPAGHSSYAKASRDAMEAYAKSIERDNSQLAADLRSWIAREDKPRAGCGCGYCNT